MKLSSLWPLWLPFGAYTAISDTGPTPAVSLAKFLKFTVMASTFADAEASDYTWWGCEIAASICRWGWVNTSGIGWGEYTSETSHITTPLSQTPRKMGLEDYFHSKIADSQCLCSWNVALFWWACLKGFFPVQAEHIQLFIESELFDQGMVVRLDMMLYPPKNLKSHVTQLSKCIMFNT